MRLIYRTYSTYNTYNTLHIIIYTNNNTST